MAISGNGDAHGDAMCPDGSHAISGGVDAGSDQAYVVASRPTPDGKGWHGNAASYYNGNPQDVAGTVYALCQAD
ncbi:hypothetical protein GCM10010430_74150 [Kitasatospora cystarginea]|uniref:Uncharacterized protein n=1 Tax=Kitasatospora cystarginea TaxID=58350 RepID=A0ABN3EYQ2_9ACTN